MIALSLLAVLLLVWICVRVVAFLRRSAGFSSGIPLDDDLPDD